MPKKSKDKTLSKKKTREKISIKPKEKEKTKIVQPEPKKNVKKQINNINPFQSNESIVKSILDKIIGISFRKANIKSICTQLDEYYFEYIQNQLNAMFSTNNIFYTDEPENPNINNSFYWKTDYNKCNTWVEITEPSNLRSDRFENAHINYVNIKPNNVSIDSNQDKSPLNKDNIKKENNNITDKKSRNLLKKFSLRNNKNDLDILEEKSSLESADEEMRTHMRNFSIKNLNSIASKKSSIINNRSQTLDKNSNNNTSQFNTGKRARNEVMEMPSKEIPGIKEEFNFEKYEPANINFLRREREDQIIRKAKENKKSYHNFNSQKNDNNQIESKNDDNGKEIRHIKMFDSNKLTFDSNGKIIKFKPNKLDTLSKDFNFIKNSVRGFRGKRKTNLLKTMKTKQDINETNKEKTKEKGTENTTHVENVIRNPIDEMEGYSRNQYMKLISEKNEKIKPSGSNFSIMLPNIGVILKENEQIKQGKREFGKYFKKYSLEDYDKILKDYVPIQNRTMMLNQFGKISRSPLTRTLSRKFSNIGINKDISNINNNNNNLMLSSLTSKNNNINNNSVILNNNSEISNPLIIQAKENDLNSNNYNMNYSLLKNIKTKNSFNNSSLSSINNFNNLSLNPNNNIYEGSIRLNKMGISSLKVEFDSLQDLDYQNINNYYSPSQTRTKNINIFGKSYRDIFKNINKNNKINNKNKDLNDFNKNIITNKGWGNKTMRKNMSSENLLFGKHQSKYQAIREIGTNILSRIKVRMPRSRKINIQI